MPALSRVRLDPDLRAFCRGRRPLALGRSAEGQVVGLVDRLVFRVDGEWHDLGWHRIDRGRWDEATRTLSWTTTDGTLGQLELTETGRLPDLFNERVTASISYVHTVALGRGRSALITARRDLGSLTAPLLWGVTPGASTTAAEVADNPVVAAQLARLRAEYDLA